jgi:hypothetical protein
MITAFRLLCACLYSFYEIGEGLYNDNTGYKTY